MKPIVEKKVLSQKNIYQIFSNIQQIYEIHQVLNLFFFFFLFSFFFWELTSLFNFQAFITKAQRKKEP